MLLAARTLLFAVLVIAVILTTLLTPGMPDELVAIAAAGRVWRGDSP